MTRDERSIKWFQGVLGGEEIPPEEKIRICNRVAAEMAGIFLVLVLIETAIFFSLGGSAFVHWSVDFINRASTLRNGKRRYQLTAILGVLVYLPFLIIPFLVSTIYRKKRIRSIAARFSHVESKNTAKVISGLDRAWLKRWEDVKSRYDCRIDLDSYFTRDKIGQAEMDVLELGMVNCPTGRLIASDLFIDIEDAKPYIQVIPRGSYPLKIAVSNVDFGGIRYACAKLEISGYRPVRYEMAMRGDEHFSAEYEEGDIFGFPVDTGMACLVDVASRDCHNSYWQKRRAEAGGKGVDPYGDLYIDLLEESYRKHPKYQSEAGDWFIWRIPGSECDFPVFSSGWGDGFYPVYFGYDTCGDVCGVYIHFIDVKEEFCALDQGMNPENTDEPAEETE